MPLGVSVESVSYLGKKSTRVKHADEEDQAIALDKRGIKGASSGRTRPRRARPGCPSGPCGRRGARASRRRSWLAAPRGRAAGLCELPSPCGAFCGEMPRHRASCRSSAPDRGEPRATAVSARHIFSCGRGNAPTRPRCPAAKRRVPSEPKKIHFQGRASRDQAKGLPQSARAARQHLQPNMIEQDDEEATTPLMAVPTRRRRWRGRRRRRLRTGVLATAAAALMVAAPALDIKKMRRPLAASGAAPT